MDNKLRIVTQTPLTSLWTDNGDIVADRVRYLTIADIKEMLKKHPFEFVIADPGLKLIWINPGQCFDFWQSERTSETSKMMVDLLL
jgi:hypothetical protein